MVPPQSQPASSLSGSSKRAMNDHPQSCPPAKRKSVTEPPAPSESTLHQHQQQQQKHQQDVFPDDDDDMLFLEMPMEAEESSSSSSLAPRENPGTAEPIPAPSACVFRQPVQPIVRPFTYLSTHLRQRAKALEDGQTGRTSANLPESICIKVSCFFHEVHEAFHQSRSSGMFFCFFSLRLINQGLRHHDSRETGGPAGEMATSRNSQ